MGSAGNLSEKIIKIALPNRSQGRRNKNSHSAILSLSYASAWDRGLSISRMQESLVAGDLDSNLSMPP